MNKIRLKGFPDAMPKSKVKMGSRKKKSMVGTDRAVARSPVASPPYQAVTITAARKKVKGLSRPMIGASSSFNSNAATTAATAKP